MRRINATLITNAPELKDGCPGGERIRKAKFWIIAQLPGSDEWCLLLSAQEGKATILYPYYLSEHVLKPLREYCYYSELEPWYTNGSTLNRPKKLTFAELDNIYKQPMLREEEVVVELISETEIKQIQNGAIEELVAEVDAQSRAEELELDLGNLGDSANVDWM